MKIIGFQSGHDVSYCILENGVPIIHEELERFIREKEPLGDGLEMALQMLPDNEVENAKYFVNGCPRARKTYPEILAKKEPDDKMKYLVEKMHFFRVTMTRL